MKITTNKLRIITNNPLVKAEYPELADFLESGADGVLKAARDCVHRGAIILSHPLSGSMLPGVCPYKSIIVTETEGEGFFNTDFKSLKLIEAAIGAPTGPAEGFTGFDQKTLDDFRVLDLDIISTALSACDQL